MIGWAYAGAALVAILVYEAVLFRYFTPNWWGSDVTGTGSGRDRGGADSAGVDGATAGEAVSCDDCGTENVSAPTVVFCCECQSRIR